MKLLLLHGQAVNNSRHKLNDIKQRFDVNNVVVFDEGSKVDEILGSLLTQSIFDEERLIILENPSEDFINYTLTPVPCTLVFWFDHKVLEKKPIIDWVKKSNGEVLLFDEARPYSVFPFLDYLAAGDLKAFEEIKKLKLSGFDIFYFITMVFYLLRNLVVTPKNVPLFVQNKLQSQRQKFTASKIQNLYKNVLKIDFKLKSGLLEISQAEFQLVDLFIGHVI